MFVHRGPDQKRFRSGPNSIQSDRTGLWTPLVIAKSKDGCSLKQVSDSLDFCDGGWREEVIKDTFEINEI